MNGTHWIIFILIIQVIHFLGTWKLYVKAGRKAWEAAIPIYNGIVLMQIINRPKWWVILLFIPIINLLMFPVVWVETIRSFGRKSLMESWLVVLTLGFYIYYVNYTLDVKYIEDRSLHPTTALGEWVSSIVFAVVAATLVHTYFIQPYVIPTGSLEKTLRIGDFLFVSKFHYGARVPITTIAAPMVHDTIPGLGIRSYVADVDPKTYKNSILNKTHLPYMRLPGVTKIDRNDIVVFSWPADTVYRFFRKERGVKKPIDKKSNYVKRCVGIPGDSLAVIDGYVYINGKQTVLPDRAKPQYDYMAYSQKGVSSKLLKELGVTDFNRIYISPPLNQNQLNQIIPYLLGRRESKAQNAEILITNHLGIPTSVIRKAGLSLKEQTDRQRLLTMTEDLAEKLKSNAAIDSVVKIISPKGEKGYNIFPQDDSYAWNNDNFGPIYLPEKGKTVALDLEVLPLYKKIIKDYEGNTLSVDGNQISINGKVTDTYTFKQDYYWMMGDNRDHSEDSRTWGYVPEDHIVGTPIFIWMSIDNFRDGWRNWSIRWDRVFTTVNGSGEPVSYFKYFILVLVGWFVFDFFRKRRKKAQD
ncbi:signal peptidase I [Maribacter polysiphoniae]|uniref:Signal peptidase I n=1 Tax=Maribacter polysiphoniae TaxID=429344 RepID=A0A316DV64_9FLAO|nr:signal peptidase I [Maribacter polysiphoniae]MBD1262720.1 signal peptidase I [Maribacter polysiphoniae]PWK21991.1 signal peptidase I [Maribacter polysiphoniae]